MKITSQMIADKCGVSRGTVEPAWSMAVQMLRPRCARVCSRRLMSWATAPRHRDGQAQPARHRTTIGFVIPGWGDYYTRQTRRGIQAALRRIGDPSFRVEIRELTGRSNHEYCTCINALEESKIAGLVLNAADTMPMAQEIDRLTAMGIPVVTCNSDVPDSARVCHIGQDLVKSGRVAAGLLVPMLAGGDVLIVCGNREFTAHRLRVDGRLSGTSV